jgi:hypothetical protein
VADEQKSLIDDKNNYLAMSAPFANAGEADKAISAFSDELYVLRNKYRIRDVHTIVSVSIVGDGGKTGDIITHGHFGDTLHSESMCAWAYGNAAAERQEAVAALVRSAGNSVKRQKDRA